MTYLPKFRRIKRKRTPKPIDLVSIEDAGYIAGISENEIIKAIDENLLQCSNVAGQKMIERKELRRFLLGKN